MGDLAPIAPKLAKLLPMLATSHDGEVVATARAIGRTLQSAGLDWHSLAAAITTPPAVRTVEREPYKPSDDYWDGMDPNDWHGMACWCREFDCGRLTPREQQFIWDMASPLRFRRGQKPSAKQHDWLRAIYVKLSRWVD
jgi:hypothetical protein